MLSPEGKAEQPGRNGECGTPGQRRAERFSVDQLASALPSAAAPAGLKPLFRGVSRIALSPALPRTPVGTRIIVDLTDGLLHGRGITAHINGASADWLTIGAEGIGTLDWRCQVVTDDGDVIYFHGTGRMDTNNSVLTYGSCLFETGSDHLRWLNKLQAVYRGETVWEGAASGVYYDEYFELV